MMMIKIVTIIIVDNNKGYDINYNSNNNTNLNNNSYGDDNNRLR